MPTYKKMDPALKAEWIAALRSGKYRQGKDYLAKVKNKRVSYCCLGVLCNLDTNVERLPASPTYGVYQYSDGGESTDSYLPRTMAKRLGLGRDVQEVLGRMNDSQGKSFSDIADWVEENL